MSYLLSVRQLDLANERFLLLSPWWNTWDRRKCNRPLCCLARSLKKKFRSNISLSLLLWLFRNLFANRNLQCKLFTSWRSLWLVLGAFSVSWFLRACLLVAIGCVQFKFLFRTRMFDCCWAHPVKIFRSNISFLLLLSFFLSQCHCLQIGLFRVNYHFREGIFVASARTLYKPFLSE